ncbi:MAG TPA: hypothetical protein VHC97_02770 [Thermoanaerobaculia bacterium]|jgi:hypothetical protein|nr:hypothetical protein [Thermoanaerobaculia bacterium]
MIAMISRMALLGSLGLLGLEACAPARPVSPRQSPRQETPPVASVPALRPIPPRVDFQKQVRPMLETRCQPCHFAGGKMYISGSAMPVPVHHRRWLDLLLLLCRL